MFFLNFDFSEKGSYRESFQREREREREKENESTFSFLLSSPLSLLSSLSSPFFLPSSPFPPSPLSPSRTHLPSPDPEVVGRAPVQARVENSTAGRHRHVVGDHLEARRGLRPRPRPDVAVAEARGELDEGRPLQRCLAGGVAEDLVLDGGRAGAVGPGGEGRERAVWGGGGGGRRRRGGRS